MRFLFVYQDFVATIEELLTELQVIDVEVIGVGRREEKIAAALHDRLAAAGGICALIQVQRVYKNSLSKLTIEQNFKKFRRDDRVLRDWLAPIPPVQEQPTEPATSFRAATRDCEWLVIADNALDRANEVTSRRWNFASKSADVLRRLALGEHLGPMRNWHENHGVEFAQNGQITFTISLPNGQQPKTQWHLKEGDKTSAEDAPRIYFGCHPVSDVNHVFVLYVGPHPVDGKFEATFNGTNWSKRKPPGEGK